MINLRRRRPFKTKDFSVSRTRKHSTNAVMRAFGNSIAFPWSTLTRDMSLADSLQDVSLLFFEIEDDSVIDVINSFGYDELIFSRMAGKTAELNPFNVLISQHDVLHCYEKYLNEES